MELIHSVFVCLSTEARTTELDQFAATLGQDLTSNVTIQANAAKITIDEHAGNFDISQVIGL